jgi:uncharacterized RDD family membrane protein YckC
METSDTTSTIPVMSAPQPQTTAFAAVQYAGFWRRFAAYFIDGIIVGAVFWIIAIIGFGGMFGGLMMHARHSHNFNYSYNSDGTYNGDPAVVMSMIMMCLAFAAVAAIGGWLYFGLMESSAKQGTLGKMAVGIKVTDLQGNRISFGRATGRYFSKILSGLILYIGYMMAGFTEKKQALHDMIAGTLVVVKS